MRFVKDHFDEYRESTIGGEFFFFIFLLFFPFSCIEKNRV
jgi:hypothetical protein